ncbi:MAG TPA: LON peptidase substrate-binding domain-containing protein [Sphingomonadaceae bacterium]|jgi:Lon protease-like protein|nr:LON peptidase substrate-binding domain-containing protein [Sphingomonadaceae bacterium]
MIETVSFPVFPLAGAILLPRAQLPLHIFEDRYRALVRHAMAGDRRIGMVQPRGEPARGGAAPALFTVGCLGEIVASEELDDGRFNIVLEGIGRFTILEELARDTPFRQVAARLEAEADEDEDALPSVLRADLERESRRYADALGFAVDWTSVARLDDEMLVNGIAQVAPFDTGSKQALLEADSIGDRADMLVQFMQFARLMPGGADGPGTLQ